MSGIRWEGGGHAQRGAAGHAHYPSMEQRMAQPKAPKAGPRRPKGSQAVYTLEVRLIGGPVTESLVEANPVVSRTIQIAGNQTLEHPHDAIYRAFNREEEHLYEF
jgi:hypothetical protein